MKLRALPVALAAAALSMTCSGGGGVGGVLVVASVDVSPGIVSVILGQTEQLAAVPKTSSGIAVTGRGIIWSSTNESIARVSSAGLVTAMAVGGPVRIRATVDGITGDAVVTVQPIPVDHVTIEPASKNLLVGEQAPLTARAFAANNAELPGRQFSWESSDHSIATVTTAGVAIGVREGGPVTITAASEGKSGTASISVSNRPATRLGFLQQPGLSIAGQALVPPVQVELLDNLLARVIGAPNPVTIALAGNPGGATLSGQLTVTPNNGIATFSDLSLNRVGTAYTFLVTSPGLVSATSTPFDVIAGSANQLAFTLAPPAAAVSGTPLSQQPVLQLRDSQGNPVAQANVQITATIASGPAGATLTGSTSATTNSFGLATFTTLTLTGTAGNYTLSFGAPSVTPLTSGAIALTAGSATALFIATQPSSGAQSNAPLPQQPAIQLRDAAGNNVAQTGVVVTAAIASGGGAVSGTTSATTNGSGLATFTSLAISGPSGTYTLRFSSGALTSVVSGPIVLGAGAPTQIAITTQPSAVAANGVPLPVQPVVQLKDASGNDVALGGVQISANLTGTPAGAALSGSVVATTNSSGTASYTSMLLTGPAGSYTLTFSSGSLVSPPSTAIALGAGAASQLSYSQQPSNSAQSGIPFVQQPILQLRDASNNPVSQANVVVTATITGAPAGVTRIGTITATTNGSGVASFVGSGLGLSGTAGSYTLTFTAGALVSPASGAIALSAGGASQLTYNQQPSTTASSGQAFAQQPVLLLRDASSNPVAGAIVTATITGSPAGITLIGTTTATTNASGVATFVGSGLGLSGQVGAYTLTFTTGAVSSTASNSISLSPGTATQLTIAQQPPSTANSGQAFATQPLLQVRDGANNPVPNVLVTAQITGSPVGATLVGVTSATTNAAGVASFVGSGLGINAPVGNYTLRFTAGALNSGASNAIALSAGIATQLTYSTQPSSSASSGVAFGTPPVLLLRDAANNPVGSMVVTATIVGSPAGVAFVGSATATTSGAGLATFAGLGLSGPAGTYTLRFTAGAVTSAASNSITLSAGGGTQLTYTQQPSSSANSGQAFATQPTLLLRDASNNPVPGIVVTATLTGSPPGAALIGTTTATTNGAGVASFVGSGLGISGTTGSYTLTFSTGTATSAASNSIALGAGTPTQLTFSTQPPANASSGVAFGTAPVLLLRDAANNPVNNVLITATITGSPAGVAFVGTTTATTNGSGLATFTGLGLSGPAGSYTLTFTAGAVTSAASSSIALSAGGGTQLTYTQQPSSSANSGQALAIQPILLLRDASNNPVPGVVVTATITGTPAGATLIGTTTATTNGSGIASFVGSGLGLNALVGNYTLTFTTGTATSVASNTIAISAGTPTQLSYSTQPPASAASGAAFGTAPVLLLRDAAGNPVNNVVVTATITGSPAGVSLVGTPTATTTASGQATFTGLGLSGPAGSYTLTFTAGAVTSPASTAVALSAGGGTQLSYNQQPSAAANSGQAFGTQPVLLLRDASNNPVSGALVTATITGAPPGASLLAGTATATTNGSGIATFSGLGITGPVGSYTLTFGSGSATSAASNSIALSAGTPAQLTYNTQPSTSAVSGTAFGTQPVLLLRDAADNPVGGVLVTATITGSPAGVSFVGTTTATTNASGLASFVGSGLGLSGPAGTYSLTFTAGAVTSGASNNITLSAGGGTQLTYNQQPSATASSGVAFAQQPILVLRDASNNPVPGVLVSASITGSPAGASLIGTTSATTDASGIASFVGSGLGLSALASNYTLTFSTGTATSVASNTITLSTGPATQLTYNTQPSSAANSGQAFGTQPVLLLRDSGNNPIGSTLVTVTITGSPAGVSFVGTASATTNGSGVATFSGLGLSGPVGNYTLTFASGAVTSAASNNISLSAGTPTQLTYNTQPSATANSGQAFGTAPVLLLRDAADNPVGSTLVTATITGSPAGVTFVGTPTATTTAAGLATFTGLGLSGPVGSYTLSFTVGALNSGGSNSIALSAGSPTQLTYNVQPSTTANNGQPFATQPVLLLRDAANNPVGSTLVTATVTGAPGGVTLIGTTAATTDGSGVATFVGSGLGLSGTAGNYTLTFTVGALSSAASNSIALSAGTPTQLTYNQQPSSTAASGQAFAQQPILLLRDAANNPVSGTLVTATMTGAPAGVALLGTTTATTSASGVATFVGTGLGLSGTAGSYTLTFTAGALNSAPSNLITLGAGSPTQLTHNTQPSATATNGQAFATQPVLLLRDAADNPVSSTLVTATITGAPAGASLIGTTTATTDAGGVATFVGTGLGLTALAGNYTLTFTVGALSSAPSNPIALSAGTATQLTYNQQPSTSATSGQAFATQPILLLRDSGNNPVMGTLVTATITGVPAGVTLIGTTSATTDGAGVASFVGTGLGLSGTPGNYTLTFTAGALNSAASNTIALAAAPPTQLTYSQQPSTAANSGQAFAQHPMLLLQDASNNPVDNTVVTATVTGSPAGVTFVGSATATTNSSGLATFTGLGLSGPVGSYTLTFTVGALTSAASNSIALSAGSPTQLTYNQQPSIAATNGVAFAAEPILLLRDAADNPIGGVLVTATITGTPAGVSLIGTPTATTDGSGVASFVGNGLGLSGTAGNYSLTFTAGALSSAASNTIALAAGSPTQLTYNQQPSTSANSGQAFAQQPIMLLRDASNNPIGGTLITATITGAPAGVALIGTTAATTNASGVASFVGSGLGLSGSTGNYTLTFTAGALSSPASNTIALAAGSPTQLSYNQQPSSASNSGQVFGQQPILLLQDAANNPVGGTVVTATVTGSPAGVSFVGTPTATTDGAGVATFSGLGLNAPVGSYTLTFTAGAATSVASGTITISAGSPTSIVANSETSQTATVASNVADPPSVKVTDSGGNPISGVSVTFAVTAGGGIVDPAGTTDGSGVATTTSWTVGLSAGTNNNTVTASATGLTGSPVPFQASGTTATHLEVSTDPPSNVASGASFSAAARLRVGVSNVNQAGIVVTVSLASGTGTLGGTVTATTNGGGIASFGGITITGSGNHTLRFSSGNLTPATSATISIP